MGKKRITELLEQLKDNQQQDIENAAAIYTVAQVAVNELRNQGTEPELSELPALPAAPFTLDKAELLRKHGSYNGCRKAAKEYGIKFSRTPSWEQLSAAFAYAEAFQQVINDYMGTYPNDRLRGTTFELTLK